MQLWLANWHIDSDDLRIAVILALPLSLVVLASVYFLWPYLRETRSRNILPNAKGQAVLNKHRKFGEWTPIDFNYPEISRHDKDLENIQPIPYRPFKPGSYHVTMGIRSMPWAEWIELDNEYLAYHRIRSHRLHTRGPKALAFLPAKVGVVNSAYEAAIELVHELAEYLIRRYPATFRVTRHTSNYIASLSHSPRKKGRLDYGWDGAPAIKEITVVPLGVTYDLPLPVEDESAFVDKPLQSDAGDHTSDPGSTYDVFWKGIAERAMKVAALLVQDDFALMVEGQDGRYYLQGGAICIPGFWRMEDKLGMPLEEIHLSGSVPQCASHFRPLDLLAIASFLGNFPFLFLLLLLASCWGNMHSGLL
ncbi:hypothetical protein EYR36_005917 [Pleurotus pulmonarius]|nr:hypothetical protein EYR36_005917 [Pleurotus pulmonarius]KAF4600625.1 hypothetical protein EYR38_005267 [Pleurotus pulmonarius]